MPLPAWMNSHRTTTTAAPTDTWKGKPLVNRTPVSDVEIHYRVRNAATGALLSFGSVGGPGSLNGVVQDVLRTQQEHPGIRLQVEQYDGPVY